LFSGNIRQHTPQEEILVRYLIKPDRKGKRSTRTMSDINQNNLGLAISEAAADAVERAGRLTVTVDARKRHPASGIAFDTDLILTADHVIEREEHIRVVLPDGQEHEAVLVGRDRGSDLALLRVENARLAPARAAEQPPRVGNLVLAVGRPVGHSVQASFGVINAIGGAIRTRRGMGVESYIAADATPYPGFSGGPLVNFAGSVFGINTSGLVQGMSLAIPFSLALSSAESISKHGRVRRGYLGIRSQTVDLPPQARESLGRQQETGLLIIGVEAAGPSAQALMVGDILVGAGGKPVADHEDLMTALSSETVGRPVALEILRGGSLTRADVTVAERG
jgi:S1-C subfamily serine protease